MSEEKTYHMSPAEFRRFGHAAIDWVDDNPVINLDFCKGCGICAEECPKKFIEMVKEGK